MVLHTMITLWTVFPSEAKSFTLELGFKVIGGDAGIPLSAALVSLNDAKVLEFRPERALKHEGPDAVLRRAYSLPRWVDLKSLVNALCEANPHVCARKPIAIWNLQDGPEKNLTEADCAPHEGKPPNLPSNYLCIPDIRIDNNTTYITRRFANRSEAMNLPKIVTQNTRACDTFDYYCQSIILQRNPRQIEAWHHVEGASHTTDGFLASNGSVIRWWESLSGTVTVPTGSLTTVVRQASTLAEGEQICTKIEDAVSAGDVALRKARPRLGPGSESTGVISTACRDAIVSEIKPGAKAQSSLARLSVDETTRDGLVAEWRSAMHWDNTREAGDGLIVGVWDGEVALVPSFARDAAQFPQLTWKTNSIRGANTLPTGSAVAWIDPFPFSNPPTSPCGERVDYPGPAHATLIAGMLAGTKEGFAPRVRLWNYIWDARRIVNDADNSPRYSLGWFRKNVVEGETLLQPLKAPFIANLSCGSTSSDPEDGRRLSLAMSGRVSLNGQTADVIPYAVSVAAGNRGPGEADEPLQDPIGYPWLARQSTTAGFLSVVGLSPRADDILRCKHIQNLVARLSQRGTDVSNTFTNQAIDEAGTCPVVRNDAATEEEDEPLVRYGPAFDVGAIGLAVGPTEVANKWAVMWGSSFAAPYVAALMADIVSKARRKGASYYPALAANLVADRIRFTSDALDNVSMFGVINAERALTFESDIVKVAPPQDPTNLSPDQQAIKQCIDNGGSVELDRQATDVPLPVWGQDIDRVPLSRVLRLRRNNEKLEAILRSKDMLVIRQIDGRDIEIPLLCRKVAAPNAGKIKLFLVHLGSFTRCSFVPNCV
jgi:hypothetical protein